jgi:Taurine catabolism dioxygenase TauD, TfdA family
MTFDLQRLAADAIKHGWAYGQGTLAELVESALGLGWSQVATRQGDPAVTALMPTDPRHAPRRSLSAKYGKGAQPLHTDGAHLTEPPDFIVLANECPNDTPTLLWRGRKVRDRIWFAFPEDLTHGVFLVSNGKDSFFSTARQGSRFRYDPGCMTPCDERARKAVSYFENAIKSAEEHHWATPGQVLVIDNRRALHARASAVDEPGRELQRVSFRIPRTDTQ